MICVSLYDIAPPWNLVDVACGRALVYARLVFEFHSLEVLLHGQTSTLTDEHKDTNRFVVWGPGQPRDTRKAMAQAAEEPRPELHRKELRRKLGVNCPMRSAQNAPYLYIYSRL